VAARLVALDRLPGINADEAWYGVQARAWLEGAGATWVTPSRRPVAFSFSGLMTACQALFAPALWSLRLPALLAGLGCVVAALALLPRALSPGAARMACILVACLPAHLAFSRIGWEMTQALLAALVACYFCLRARWPATAAAVLAGLYIHPAFVFLGLILLGPLVVDLASGRVPLIRKAAMGAAAALALVAAAWLARRVFPSFSPEGQGLGHLADLGLALVWGFRLFSGYSAFEDFAGPLPPAAGLALDLAFVGPGLLLWVAGTRALVRQGRRREAALALGVPLSLAAFLYLTGTRYLAATYERYMLFLTVPMIVCLSLFAQALWGERRAELLGLGMGALMLVLFAALYLWPLQTAARLPFKTYWTGPREPKAAAFLWMEADRRARGLETAGVLAGDFWTEWPLRYLACRNPHWTLWGGGNSMSASEAAAHLEAGGYAVAYRGDPLEAVLARLPGLRCQEFADGAGRPAVLVWCRP
jgi:hypothetical protein